MSPIFRGMLGSMFLLVVALPLRADDADTAKAIIDKAIKAAGSEEKFTKLKAATMKFKGIIHQPDMNISFTGEIVSQGADQTRVVIQADYSDCDHGRARAPAVRTRSADQRLPG